MKITKRQLRRIIKEEIAEASKGLNGSPKIQQNFSDLANTVYHFDDTTIPLLTGLVDNLDKETAEAAKDLLQRVQQLKSDMRKYSGV